MGVFTGLLTLPLAPVRGVAWIGERALDQATREMADPAEIYQQLAELDQARAAGEITGQECAAAEDRLVAGLMQARESRAAGVWP
ncbi:MAG TPA: gas vesicle protein GvpG [Streptosporangiaceae bacterium]|nr:gas vesicle protein GvpG [Streptosporangiaceae bacterium]